MAKKKTEGVSLNPEDFIEGGGLIDDVDVIFAENLFEMFDYGGKADTPAPCLKIALEVADVDDPVEQYYSMGSANDWIPSEDGTQLVAVGKATNIRATSNGGIFLKSLLDAGFPAEDLGDDITVLDGLQAHMIQVPAPKRTGLKKTKDQEAREERFGPPMILVVSEIIALPGEKKKPKGATTKGKTKTPAKGKGTTKTKKDAPADDALNDKSVAAVMELLADKGSMAKKDLPGKIFQSMKDDPDRNAIVKTVFDDEFLENGPWEYDDGVLVMG